MIYLETPTWSNLSDSETVATHSSTRWTRPDFTSLRLYHWEENWNHINTGNSHSVMVFKISAIIAGDSFLSIVSNVPNVSLKNVAISCQLSTYGPTLIFIFKPRFAKALAKTSKMCYGCIWRGFKSLFKVRWRPVHPCKFWFYFDRAF